MVANNAVRADRALPSVSVIVPVHNDPGGLSETLGALAQQEYPVDCWEVIVVDNNSTDNTTDVARSFTDRIPVLRILVERTLQSSYAARNRGIEKANGEVLAFIDADMTVAADWVRRGVHDIVKGSGDYVGCRVDIYTRRSPPNIWEIYNQRTGFPIRSYLQEQGYTIAGGLFVRRGVFDSVGLFDERVASGGDLEFGNRVKAGGFRLYYAHDNVMRHPARSSLRSIWRKYFRIGGGNVDLRYYYPDRYGPLRPWSVIPLFRPALRLSGAIDTSGLDGGLRLGMLFVANVIHFATACGRMVRCVEIGMGVGLP